MQSELSPHLVPHHLQGQGAGHWAWNSGKGRGWEGAPGSGRNGLEGGAILGPLVDRALSAGAGEFSPDHLLLLSLSLLSGARESFGNLVWTLHGAEGWGVWAHSPQKQPGAVGSVCWGPWSRTGPESVPTRSSRSAELGNGGRKRPSSAG